MHSSIKVISEGRRGCGYRKVGGLYLRFDGATKDCGKLPVPLEVCPCCGEGIRPSRAPRMLQRPYRLWENLSCRSGGCFTCPLADSVEITNALLIWIGEKYYPTPENFIAESHRQGISRRINSIPQNFIVGESWVLLAHKKAIALPTVTDTNLPGLFAGMCADGEQQYQAGIFSVFKPDRIEIVVSGNESDEVIEGYLKRGLMPVFIETEEIKQHDLF